MKHRCLHRVALRAGAMLLAGSWLWTLPTSAQEKDKKPPPVEVIGEKEPKATPKETEPKQPEDQEPPQPPPNPNAGIGTGVLDFTYPGSPLGQYDYSGSTIGGAPGSIFNSDRSFTTINQAQINERSAGATPQLFQNIPGVLVQRTNAGGGSLIIRGRNGNQNVIMIDYVPINDAGWRFGNVQYLNTIDEGVIERIEVIRGPESVLYGSGATGGVVNIVTKSRKDFSQTVAANGNFITNYSSAWDYGYNRGELSANFSNLGIFAGTDYFSSGSLHAGDGVTFPAYTVGYQQTAADVRLDYLIGDNWRITMDYQHLNQPQVPRTDRFPLPQVDPTRFVNRPTVFEPQERDFGYFRIIGFDNAPGPINALMFTFNMQQRREGEFETRFDRIDRRTRLPEITDSFENVVNWGLDLRGFTNLFTGNTLTYGTTYYHDAVDAIRLRRRIDRRRIDRRSGQIVQITPALPPDGVYSQFGIFLMDRWQVFDWLTLTAGIRYSNVNAEGTVDAFGPNRRFFNESFQNWPGEVGFVLKLTETLNWVGSIAGGFRAPNLEDLGSSDRSTGRGQDFGVTDLSAERCINYETGFKYQDESIYFACTYYYNDFPNQIVRIPAGGGVNLRQNTEGFIHGVELEGQWLLTSNWSLYAIGSQTYGQDTLLNVPQARINPAFATLGTRWTYRTRNFGFFLDCFCELSGKQTRLNPSDLEDIRIPIGGNAAWQTANLRCGFDLNNLGRLYLGYYNIFDQNYRVLGSGIDAPGAEFRLGYQVTF